MKTQKRNYELVLTTPDGRCQIEAQSPEGLVELAPGRIANALNNSSLVEKDGDFEQTARAAQQAYNQRYVLEKKRLALSRAARVGFELDTIKCYLQGFTIPETRRWLKDNRGITASKSSIGRYWQNLHKLGVIPNPDFCLARL